MGGDLVPGVRRLTPGYHMPPWRATILLMERFKGSGKGEGQAATYGNRRRMPEGTRKASSQVATQLRLAGGEEADELERKRTAVGRSL